MISRLVWNRTNATCFTVWNLWIALFGISCLPNISGNGQWTMAPDDLWGFWYMDKATTTYNETSNTFTFDYKVNMHLGVSITENLRADIFASDCVSHVGAAEGIIYDTINSNGEHVFQFDYAVLRKDVNSHVFQVTGKHKAQADFCLRFSMWTGPASDTTAQRINWIDTLLIIYFSMDGPLSVTLLTQKTIDNGRHNTFEEEKYEASAYICDPVTRERVMYDTVTQGMVISMCVYLEEPAIDQGLVVDEVRNFKWYRDFHGFTMVQIGFEEGVNYDGLTISYCGFNVTECHFETMISAPFFYTSGFMYGEGEILMKWRPTNPRRSRSVRRQLEIRALQDDSSIWGDVNGFNTTVNVQSQDDDAWQLITAGGIPVRSRMVFTVASVLVAVAIFS